MDSDDKSLYFNSIEQRAGLDPIVPIENAPEALIAIRATAERLNHEINRTGMSPLFSDKGRAHDLRRDLAVFQQADAQLSQIIPPLEISLEEELQRYIDQA